MCLPFVKSEIEFAVATLELEKKLHRKLFTCCKYVVS